MAQLGNEMSSQYQTKSSDQLVIQCDSLYKIFGANAKRIFQNSNGVINAEDFQTADCVIVVVPDNLHFDIVKNCILAKKHVLVVKPLTPSLIEAQELTNLAKQNNIYGAVEFHKRLDAANLKLRDFLSS